MSESKAKETWPLDLIIEHKHGSELTAADFDDCAAYLDGEIAFLKQAKPNNSTQYKERIHSSMNNSLITKYLETARDKNPQSVITFVKKQNGSIIGMCVTLVEKQHGKKQGIDAIIGIGWDYQKRGLGTQIMGKHIQQLKSEHIESISGTVWTASRRILEKLGYSFPPGNDIKISLK